MHFSVSFLAAAIIALAAPASAAPSNAPKSKASSVSSAMLFYLAKGEADACGEGCSEWIAAEGEIDGAAAQRLRSFLNRLGKRRLPIFFHSPGGVGTTATEMGRLLRALEMAAGVSKTMPNGCVGASEQDCRALKQSGQVLPATLQPIASCSSACVFALIGAKVRQVPAPARLGVHQAKLTIYRRDGGKLNFSDKRVIEYQRTRLATLNGQLRRYVQEMKVDVRLFDLGMTIPHESVHYLSRDEIVKFGVDTREFQETRWDTMELRPPDLWAMKFFVPGRNGERKELHTSFLQVSCGRQQRVRVVYFRHATPDEAAAPKSINLTADDRSVTFSSSASPVKLESIETGGSYNLWATSAPFDFLEAAAALEKIELTELGEANAVLRATKLSTGGMASAISALRKRCSAAAMIAPSMTAQ